MNKERKIVLPPGKIGIVGGGQLGKMLALEAKKMGYKVIVLEESLEAPAAQVADKTILGSLLDGEKIKELAKEVDVLTYEFEFINSDILCELEKEGHSIYPSGRTLKKIQNKYKQKILFKESGLPVPKLKLVKTVDEIYSSINEFCFPMVLKCCSGGYDGKGNYIIKGKKDMDNLNQSLDFNKSQFMIEEFIKFEKELSVVVVRGQDGSTRYFPIGENKHENSILKVTKVPALIPKEVQLKIRDISNEIINLFNDVGVFCIEFFITEKNDVYINEVAPRPHNSGHYSIEGCVVSQFEQQLRAITGLPLGSTELISPAVMVNVLGKNRIKGNFIVKGVNKILDMKNVNFHFYGKRYVDFEKKIGHITVLNKDLVQAENIALEALKNINIVEEF